MNAFEENLIRKLGAENFKKVQKARVGIAGAGGLGSNCAACLVRTGFRNFTIADFDRVDATNLDRQFYFADQIGMEKTEALKVNLLRINPALELKMVQVKLEPANISETFRDCDIVAECLDRADAKSMLVAELLSAGKFTVSVSGLGGIGASDEIKTQRAKKNLILIGDLRSDIEKAPALSPRVSVAAAKQADAILAFVTGKLS
ncbi:MAG TPA: sulfur carrier protein ThiS adenylyltransferase ThiF [Candidatus Omnitrophota bacterium]|nr:sulfur carrier protein ThiS adenylyltransferase ThiF [Candidatus Omnitrophota bacterium]HRY85502.1 sulfur carrier protein ThiS adenylyltransferase ThiF [Candidatus Omnitrophota bacterium]